MYQYSLYLFKARFAEHFYYKIDVLYRFLFEQVHSTDEQTPNQLITVLDEMNLSDIVFHLQYELKNIQCDVYNNTINIKSGKDEVIVHVSDFSLDIYADSLFVADRLFFRYIKSFHPHIFVVNFDTFDCGWISPLAKRELYRI
ncbi:sporulation inhibitor of replication protein SirA [Bacillaceae bacterium W0354]